MICIIIRPISKIHKFNLNRSGLALRVFLILIISLLHLSADDFQFAVVADCQYCNQPDRGSRKYKDSTKRFQEFVDFTKDKDLKFGVHLGDFIDKDYESFAPLLKIQKGLKYPFYHVLGNHDFSVKDELKKEVPKLLGMPARYYSFEVNGWVFVALDGNDLSFHGHPKGSEKYKESEKYYKDNKLKAPKYNGGMGSEQVKWLTELLKKAETDKKSVILFSHFPVYPANHHNLWNDKEIVSLLSKYKCVKAYINGHNHKGNYAEKEGIHYFTQKGMVENVESTYSIITLQKSQISIKGFGAVKDKTLIFK